jgi:ubiquinone/menaquinone biosynthesis C-methylase UbiE
MRDLAKHWEKIYQEKVHEEVSWYTPHLERSLELILRTGIDKNASIIDVGGGASTLVDDLLARSFKKITVLDISGEALEASKIRLGSLSNQITWIEGDIKEVTLLENFYDVWHDRALFHFLTRPEDRQKYVHQLDHSLKAGGHLIMAIFGLKGPPRCSGLDIVRYTPKSLLAELSHVFTLLENFTETHGTPFGTNQEFIYCHFRKG